MHILDLFAEESWRDVYAGGLEMRLDHDFLFTMEECRFPSTYRLFTPQVGRGAARGRAGRGWLGVGGLRWARSGSSFAASRGYGLTATTIFLYHYPKRPGARRLCDFGVKVTRTFETAGEVFEAGSRM